MANTGVKRKLIAFKVVKHPNLVPKSGKRVAFLIEDNWDDWGKFQTQYSLIVFDDAGVRHLPGEVKIGQFNLKPSTTPSEGHRMPAIPTEFNELDETCFSLGQSDTYYQTL